MGLDHLQVSRPHHPLYVQCSPRSFTHAGSRECVMLTLNFSSALPGTVLDKDGQGTGFTYVQPNTTGNQYDATRINLEPTAGTLVLTGTLGTNTTVNTQERYNFRLMPLSPLRAVPGSKVRLPISTTSLSAGGIFLGSRITTSSW